MRATLIVTPHITIVWPVDDLLDLAAVVVEERPEYAPPVVDGSVKCVVLSCVTERQGPTR